MVLVYTNGPTLAPAERQKVQELEREGQTIRYRNAQFWKGEIEGCDAVVTSIEKVRDAYRLKGHYVIEVEGRVPPPPPRPRITHERKSGGWWSICVNGKEVRSVRQSGLRQALEDIRVSLV